MPFKCSRNSFTAAFKTTIRSVNIVQPCIQCTLHTRDLSIVQCSLSIKPPVWNRIRIFRRVWSRIKEEKKTINWKYQSIVCIQLTSSEQRAICNWGAPQLSLFRVHKNHQRTTIKEETMQCKQSNHKNTSEREKTQYKFSVNYMPALRSTRRTGRLVFSNHLNTRMCACVWCLYMDQHIMVWSSFKKIDKRRKK